MSYELFQIIPAAPVRVLQVLGPFLLILILGTMVFKNSLHRLFALAFRVDNDTDHNYKGTLASFSNVEAQKR